MIVYTQYERASEIVDIDTLLDVIMKNELINVAS